MRSWCRQQMAGMVLAGVLALAACQTHGPAQTDQASQQGQHMTFPAPVAWGGEMRCGVSSCQLVLVEHDKGYVVLHQYQQGQMRELDRQEVAYHPDSAKWLNDEWVAAAVERDHSLDMFRVEAGKLVRGPKVRVGFPPRDVVVLEQKADRFTLMATPYSGSNVAFVEWTLGAQEAKVTSVPWCEAPWHPAKVSHAPGSQGPGVVAACLDGKKLLYTPSSDWTSAPKTLATFDVVARQARPSPSGQWVYVALELGGHNARVNMTTGELQYLPGHPSGSVSVAPLSDELIVWGESNTVYLQRIDEAGKVLETRWLQPSGFPTELQLIDLNGDGERDLLVLNSAGERADVFYGPLWERAQEKL